MINNLVLVGRATRDPEITKFESGKVKAKLGIALNRPTKEKETDFFDVEVWGKSAEIVEQYVKKGHLFGVEGRIQQETWTKDDKKHSKVIVVAQNVRLMQPKGDGEAAEQQSNAQSSGQDAVDPFANFDEGSTWG